VPDVPWFGVTAVTAGFGRVRTKPESPAG